METPVPWNDFPWAESLLLESPTPVEGLSVDGVDATRFARRFKELSAETARLRADADGLRKALDGVLALGDHVARDHAAFVSALGPFEHAHGKRMAELVQEYGTLRREMVDAWKAAAGARVAAANLAADAAAAELAAVRSVIVAGAKEVVRASDAATGKKLCPLCFDDEVTVACVPCGHTLCAACASKISGRCSTCRTFVRETVRLYFSV